MLHFRPSPRANHGATESRHPLSWCTLAIAALAVIAASPAAAADPPLSLAEALKLAVARSQQLASQRSMVDAAREMAIPAGELPDPKLKAGVENVPTQGEDAWSLTRDFMTMSKIGLMQEFPREEKRRLKVARVERDAERGTAVIEATTLAIERETATAWVTRHFADRGRDASIGASWPRPTLNVTTMEAAYRAGKAPQSELIAAQSMLVEISESRHRRRDAGEACADRAGALRRRRGAAPAGRSARFRAPAGRRSPRRRRPPARAAPRPRADVDRRDRNCARPRGEEARLERRGRLRVSRRALREHGVGDVHHRPAVVAGHAPGPRARGEAQGGGRRARDAGGHAANARRRGAGDADRMGVGARAVAAHRDRAPAARACSAARRRRRPIAAAPERWPRCSTRGARCSTPSSASSLSSRPPRRRGPGSTSSLPPRSDHDIHDNLPARREARVARRRRRHRLDRVRRRIFPRVRQASRRPRYTGTVTGGAAQPAVPTPLPMRPAARCSIGTTRWCRASASTSPASRPSWTWTSCPSTRTRRRTSAVSRSARGSSKASAYAPRPRREGTLDTGFSAVGAVVVDERSLVAVQTRSRRLRRAAPRARANTTASRRDSRWPSSTCPSGSLRRKSCWR